MSNYFENMQDGVSQFERQLDALNPAYVKVDSRSTFDLLAQLTALSTEFNYYNFQDQRDGDWQDFFQSDLVIMLILLPTSSSPATKKNISSSAMP